eukprot:m.123390 g.123390  ORF g.123390 m.123390 type:complete len:474 (+) comp16248_c1_seq1:679-2100(+)
MARHNDPPVERPPLLPATAATTKAAASNFVPSIANLSIQYNLSAASIAVSFMTSDRDRSTEDHPERSADFPEPAWGKYMLLGMVFAGAVVGMCLMGFLGDLIGRRKALLFTMSLTIFGSLGCAVLPWGSADAVYAVISCCRFLLGAGVGGIYPLSAVKAAESASPTEHKGKRVGWAFFWQTPGAMLPYVVGLLLLTMPQTSWATSLQFRILFGLGALPAIIVFMAELKQDDSPSYQSHHTGHPLRDAMAHPKYFKRLIGTGGAWFMYDISYYGIAIFTPDILKSIFGEDDDLMDLCWQSIVVSALGIPACILAVVMLPWLGGRRLNIWGFYLLAVSFAALALTYNLSPHGMHTLKFVLFCLVTFALNWGPNVATYVLPAEAYPVEFRSTFHGLSAACAKIGAVTGTFIYQPIADRFNMATVMWLQVVLSLIGAAMSYFFLEEVTAYTHQAETIAEEQDADDAETSPLVVNNRR